jgi:hypothetical protein
MIRTIARDAVLALGGAYAVVCVAVIAGAAIADRFGKDHDRRNGGST